ncbi:YabP/YqfC family sporulation protein, partial [Limnohabitans sp. Rim47]
MSSFEHKGENHEFTLTNRKYLSMSGVKEVISYNEHQIHLETVQGSCLVK